MITRNNLKVTPQDFLVFLSSLVNVEDYNYNCIDKTLEIQEGANWSATDETLLDDWITANTIEENFILLEVNNINIESVREFTKKTRKQSSIKDKIISFDYDYTAKYLKVKVLDTWTTANQETFDGVLDALVGYDVVIQLMDGYEIKEKDGKRYYNKKRSELVDKINKAEITSTDAFTIDTKLKDVKDSLRSGDWITAQTYLTSVVVEGPFTQALKDEYDVEITDYITNNY
ncbi:MAG: hypothetical protein KAJ19_10285 [Gammaproteobacteria bacterium]|nr:hypothetical protein [Gammaproteobacteria bacterium]